MGKPYLVHVYIEPPSNTASCLILCGLTAGCMWANFSSDIGLCAMSDSVCPRPVDHLESSLFPVVHDMVVLRLYVVQVIVFLSNYEIWKC